MLLLTRSLKEQCKECQLAYSISIVRKTSVIAAAKVQASKCVPMYVAS